MEIKVMVYTNTRGRLTVSLVEKLDSLQCEWKSMHVKYTVFMGSRIHAFISRFQPIRVYINAISWIRQHTKVDYEFNLKAWNGDN